MALNMNIPAGVSSNATVRVTFVPDGGVADPSAPTVSELDAGTDISCHLMSDGYSRTPNITTEDARRACEESSYQVITGRSVTFEAVRFVHDPQGTDATLNEVYDSLVEGENYYILERLGISGKTELASGDVYDLYHVRLDYKDKLPTGNAEFQFAAQFANLGTPTRDGVLAA